MTIDIDSGAEAYWQGDRWAAPIAQPRKAPAGWRVTPFGYVWADTADNQPSAYVPQLTRIVPQPPQPHKGGYIHRSTTIHPPQ
jgi:hypothetical protein